MSHIAYMIPLRTARTTGTPTAATTAITIFRGVQQKKPAITRDKTGWCDLVEIEVAIKALDNHIERLEAKLSFLIESYDDNPHAALLYQ